MGGMPFEFEHIHYRDLQDNPEVLDKQACFKVLRDGVLVAVIRSPVPVELIEAMKMLTGSTPRDSTVNYRVDCRVAADDMKAAISAYLPDKTFDYFENPTWTWKDDAGHEAMPWKGKV
jgi:hypothetical protein